MKTLFLFSILFGAVTFLVSKTPPQRCDEIQIDWAVTLDGNNSFQISTTLQVSIINQQNYITISNFFSQTFEGQYYFDFACFAINNTILCPNNFTDDGFGYLFGNVTYALWAHQTGHNTTIPLMDLDPLYTGIVDEGSFTEIYGAMFTEENRCFTNTTLGDLQFGNGTQCCTSFKPIKEAQINSRCKSFYSRTTVYNADENYSIYATSKIIYQLNNDSTISFESEFIASEDLSVEYDYNDNYICDGFHSHNINCSFPISSENSKIFLQMSTRNGTSQYEFYIPIARLILRDGQALIEEGQTYTPNSECSYLSEQLNSHHFSTSQFCCSEFESF